MGTSRCWDPSEGFWCWSRQCWWFKFIWFTHYTYAGNNKQRVEWKIPPTPWWSITLNEPWKWLVNVEPFLPVMSLLRCNICSLDCSVTLLARHRIAPFLQDPANLFLSLYMMFTCSVGEVQFASALCLASCSFKEKMTLFAV